MPLLLSLLAPLCSANPIPPYLARQALLHRLALLGVFFVSFHPKLSSRQLVFRCLGIDRLQIIKSVVKPTIRWMCQTGSHDIWQCVDRTTHELLGVSVWLSPGVRVSIPALWRSLPCEQVEIPFKQLFTAAMSTLSTIGVHGVKKVKRYLQVGSEKMVYSKISLTYFRA